MCIHLNVGKQMTDVKFLMLHSNNWNHLSVYKKWLILNGIISIRLQSLKVCKKKKKRQKRTPDLALNNLQWLICHKTQPNQIIYI